MPYSKRKQELLSIISDMHKDAYGIRPHGMDYCDMTEEELNLECDTLHEAVLESIAEEDSIQKGAIVRFEKKILELIETGAGDRATAIRWLQEAEEDEQCIGDSDYFCYINNLPYKYFKEVA